MLRVVIDTNVIVSALLSPLGNPAKIHKIFLAGLLTFVYSSDILDEYQDVLSRPRLKIPADEIEIVFSAIKQYGELTEPLPSTDDMVDESDRIFYDAAKSAGAYLITGNMRHYPQESFILTPKEFLDL
jgi:putative PIN family toxin of toxin-antitoxin system